MFLLVGKELVKAQEASDKGPKAREEWKHTQNWIAYEIGLACERGIDVWVWCDYVTINFPVPYLNNYALYGVQESMRNVIENYSEGYSYPLGSLNRDICCSYENCKATYNLQSIVDVHGEVTCPTCLKSCTLPEGWLLEWRKTI